MRWLRRSLFLILVLVLTYSGAALIGGLVPARGERGEGDIRAYLVRGPIHYDFLLPLTAATRDSFAFLREAGFELNHPDAKWLVIGWGAKDFYTTAGTYKDVNLRASSPNF